MTVLRHRVLDAQSKPVAGRVATAAVYDPDTTPGRYHRAQAVSATSGPDGWLSWTLPPGRRKDGQPARYAVVGIEPQPVLVTPPAGVSTVTVTECRTGTLPIAEASERDLVTEEELAARLAGVTKDLAADPTLGAAIEAQIGTRLDGLTLKRLTQVEHDGLAVKDPDTLYVIRG